MSDKGPPRYEQIAGHLRELVSTSQPGDRLPSEAELCEQFGVSRMTARQAVQLIASEGMVERRRGAGTFVRSRPVSRELGSSLSFSENMRSRGMSPSSQVLGWDLVEPTADERDALDLDLGERVFALERLRLADGTPMAIERAVMSEPLGAEIADHVGSGSLHDLFRRFGRIPSRAHAEVTASRATRHQSELLALPSTGIVIVERRTIFDQDSLPLERTVTWYASARYSFQAVLVSEHGLGHA